MSNKVDHVDESEERILNDDYKNWKKSVSFLYDLVMTHALHWPSFTLEWLPSDVRDGKIEKSRLLLGATTDNNKSQVLLADVYLPTEDDLDPTTPFGTFKTGLGKIEIQRRIPHLHTVTRARHMPQRPELIATTSSNGDINVFDIDDESYSLSDIDREDLGAIPDENFSPLLHLKGNCGSSATLSWNEIQPGYVISVDRDNSVRLWDVCQSPASDGSLDELARFEGHTSQVNDVCWWNQLTTVFVSGASDGSIGLWDVRSRCRTRASHVIKGHKKAVTSVAPSPFSRHMFVSGSEDGTVALWDVRYLSAKIHSLSAGGGPVSQARWSPHSPSLLASSSATRVVSVWDLDVLHDSDRQSQALSPDDPPELVFVHGGHSSTITDLGWHPSAKNVLASTASDNIIQIWRPMESFLTGNIVAETQRTVPGAEVSVPEDTTSTAITAASL